LSCAEAHAIIGDVNAAERDEFLRLTCFSALDRLRSRFGDDLPLRGGLAGGFTFEATAFRS
jgi:hypothetical protein